jgi:MFS family permease
MRRHGSRRSFALWLSAATLSTLGDAITFFALGWVAAGHSAEAASLVLTVEGVPLCLLILAGGTLADRWGIRRMMVWCDAAMALVMGLLAVGALAGAPLWLLVVVALLSGTAAALRRPADGVFPRLFATGDQLARAMAVVSLCYQLARLAGPAVAGALIATGGLPLTSALDAASYALVLGVLLMVRPPYEPKPDPDVRQPAIRHVLEGITSARRTPGAPAALLAVVGLAMTVIPLVALCLPVVGREREWSSHATGLVAAAWLIGGVIVTAYVAKRGAPGRVVAIAGPGVAAAGALVLASTRSPAAAFAAAALVGVGTSMLTTRLIPRFIDAAPTHMLARFQSLLGIAQNGPILVAIPTLGAIAAAWGVDTALVLLTGIMLLTTLAALAAERATPSSPTAADPGSGPITADATCAPGIPQQAADRP